IASNRCFAFIVFFYLIQVSHSLSLPHCERISGSWLSIWNEGGEFWCEAPASRNEPDPQPSPDQRQQRPTMSHSWTSRHYKVNMKETAAATVHCPATQEFEARMREHQAGLRAFIR